MTDMTNEERAALIELADGATELSTEMTRSLARRGLATYTHGPNGRISFITPTGRALTATLKSVRGMGLLGAVELWSQTMAPLKEEAGQ